MEEFDFSNKYLLKNFLKKVKTVITFAERKSRDIHTGQYALVELSREPPLRFGRLSFFGNMILQNGWGFDKTGIN